MSESTVSKLAGVTPFPPDFATRYRAAGYWKDRPQGAFYDEVFASHGERTAMVSGRDSISYAQLRERANRLARHLLALGVRPLDRFVVQLPNVPEFVYLYFALQRLGAIPIMALAPHRWTEISAFVEHAGARGYIAPGGQDEFADMGARLLRAFPALDLVLSVDGAMLGASAVAELLVAEPSVPASALDALRVDPAEPCV